MGREDKNFASINNTFPNSYFDGHIFDLSHFKKDKNVKKINFKC